MIAIRNFSVLIVLVLLVSCKKNDKPPEILTLEGTWTVTYQGYKMHYTNTGKVVEYPEKPELYDYKEVTITKDRFKFIDPEGWPGYIIYSLEVEESTKIKYIKLHPDGVMQYRLSTTELILEEPNHGAPKPNEEPYIYYRIIKLVRK